MAALDFPAAPTNGQTFAAPNNVIYQWQATPGIWIAIGVGATSPGGDFSALQTSGFPALTAAFVTAVVTPVITGNALVGGVAPYNVSNGRYTPPAGRYLISCGMSVNNTTGPQTIGVRLRKNGTTLEDNYDSLPAANHWSNPDISLLVDASGTDWFDMQITSGGGGGGSPISMYFQAFPISGIKGPQGDPDPGVATALRLYSEQVCVGGETQLNVTIPPNAKRIELEFSLLSAAGDPAMALQVVESGVPNAGSIYGGQQLFAQAAGVGAASVAPQTSWNLGGTQQAWGTVKLMRRGGPSWGGSLHNNMISNAGLRYVQLWEYDCAANPVNTTGLRVTIASSSFSAGNFLRAFVVT
jgi:hypothetical protein